MLAELTGEKRPKTEPAVHIYLTDQLNCDEAEASSSSLPTTTCLDRGPTRLSTTCKPHKQTNGVI